ncbi:MAG TPA: hypothetical protein PK082_06210 [Phycisphaerae bacterium]|nr:hypothetical protein [Phycisphaerae bacterium]
MVTNIAQAVADTLNEQDFSVPFTAERVALPEFDLAAMQELHVTVVPRQVDSEVLDRGRDAHDVKVDVAVQKKVASIANEEIDPLLALVQEIADFLNRRNLDGAIWKKTENNPVYSPEHLREMRQFTSVLTITYRVVR